MAQRLMYGIRFLLGDCQRRRAIVPMALITLCGFAASVQGESLPDPTEPPSSLNVSPSALKVAPAEPVLQAIQNERGRFYAMIDGRALRVGDQLGAAKVVKISPNEVELRDDRGNKTLKLLPDSSSHAIIKIPAAGAKTQPKAQ